VAAGDSFQSENAVARSCIGSHGLPCSPLDSGEADLRTDCAVATHQKDLSGIWHIQHKDKLDDMGSQFRPLPCTWMPRAVACNHDTDMGASSAAASTGDTALGQRMDTHTPGHDTATGAGWPDSTTVCCWETRLLSALSDSGPPQFQLRSTSSHSSSHTTPAGCMPASSDDSDAHACHSSDCTG